MSRLPTATSAMALTLPEQDLNQQETQVSTGLANPTAADNPGNWRTQVASELANTLAATTANLTTQRTYLSNLSDSLTTGIGSLVDAKMNEAATKLAALQDQQELGGQALSLSNSDTRLILKLFEL